MISPAVRGVVTTTALTTVCVLLPTSAAGADAGDKDIEKVTVTGVTVADNRPDGVRAGDSWTMYLKLYTPKRKRAGDGTSQCTAVEVTARKRLVQCTRVLRLKKGSLVLADLITHQGRAAVTARTAILGGTGHYNDAEGQGTVTVRRDRIRFSLAVDD
ncbi:hypothetical protein ACWC5C_09615 [Streptomyces sp. NPDC001700]